MTITVLVVDDDEGKRRLVSDALRNSVGPAGVRVTEAEDVVQAKRLLKHEGFELLVLDLALPMRRNDDAEPLAGLDLLEEVLERDIYNVPPHIVGLTAHKELFAEAESRFTDNMFSLVYFDRTSEAWVDAIQAKVRNLRRAKLSPNVGYESDIAILTALQDPELDAVLRALNWNWTTFEVSSDSTVYYRGEYKYGGNTRIAFAARAANMGMPAAALLASKMVMHFKPRCLVMPGICAGDSSEVSLGDLIVANPAWDYGAGKYSDKDGDKRFDPAAFPIPLGTRIRGLVDRLERSKSELDEIRAGYPVPPVTSLRLHPGPMGSGAAVLGDHDKFKEVQAHQRKAIGVDMEAYSIMLAAYELPSPTPEALVIKGVSDFANADKNSPAAKAAKPFAAYASAKAVELLATRYGL